jgi:hypothetical protein
MKDFDAAARHIVVLIAGAFCLITLSQATAFAQRSNPASVDRRVDQLNRQGEQYSRDEIGREFKGKKRPSDQKQAQALAAQIKNDFERLQASYNQIVLAIGSRKVSSYVSVLDPLTEMNKHASRLKTTLLLPQLKDVPEKESPAASKHEEDTLVTLQKHVYNFLTNPLFEARGVFEIEQARKASKDLDKVIELSESIIGLAHQDKKALQ